MKTYLLTYLLLLSFSACGCGEDYSYKIIDISFDEYQDLKLKSYKQDIDTNLMIKKTNGVLTLPLNSGKTVVYKDTLNDTDDADKKKYDYSGYLKTIDSYLVMASYYENGELFLINKNSGEISSLWSLPLISPQKTYLATMYGVLGYAVVQNGIQLFKVNDNSVKLLFEIEINDYEPNDGEWVSDNVLIFKKIIPEDYSITKQKEIKYAKLIIDKK